MIVEVLKEFIDKTNGNKRFVGEKFECTKKRYTEILKAGNFVKEVKK